MEKEKGKTAVIASLILIALIWVVVPFVYKNKFWAGLAGLLTLPVIFVAFIADNLYQED